MAAIEGQTPRRAASLVQHATQLEFTQAMQDFRTMFPDVDEDVIEAVLRANQGAVDATIDQLLTMSTDNENERLRTEMDAADNAESPPSYSPTTPPPSYQQAVPCTVSHSLTPSATPPPPPDLSAVGTETVAAAAAAATAEAAAVESSVASMVQPTDSEADVVGAVCPDPAKATPKWQPPLLGPLPVDFLRIAKTTSQQTLCTREMTAVLCSEIIQQKLEENERQRRLGSTDDPELVRYLEDERIALFFQNEEFMQELRRNKDFLSTLDRDSQVKRNVKQPCDEGDSDDTDDLEDPPVSSMGTFPFAKSVPSEDSDAAFREKLKNMGKLSRRKFAQLARLFSRSRKRSAQQILSEGAVPSQDNLLLEVDDDEDDVEESQDDGTNMPKVKFPHTNAVCSESSNGPIA